MHKILSLIKEAKANEIKILQESRQEIMALAKKAAKPISFFKSLQSKDSISLVAELKQASPSRGILRKDFNHLSILQLYEKGGASAVSVVTEEEFFLGKPRYLKEVKERTKLPVLRKDFILDEIQIYQSRALGADAVLLILRMLAPEKFQSLYRLARDLGMDVLVEVHTMKELNRAITAGVNIIGINNRNLDTFTLDLEVTAKIAPFVPDNVLVISESGINSAKDILWLKGLGIDAVLVGEALMESNDIEAKLKEFHEASKS